MLSESTEAYDRGEKFVHYQRVAALADYVLVSPERARVELFHRQNERMWLYTLAEGLDATLTLLSLGVTLALADLYDKVAFPPEPAPPE